MLLTSVRDDVPRLLTVFAFPFVPVGAALSVVTTPSYVNFVVCRILSPDVNADPSWVRGFRPVCIAQVTSYSSPAWV